MSVNSSLRKKGSGAEAEAESNAIDSFAGGSADISCFFFSCVWFVFFFFFLYISSFLPLVLFVVLFHLPVDVW